LGFAYAVNKRLDEWVSEERLDQNKVLFPKKVQPSRPASPVPGDIAPLLPAQATSTAVMKKKKKRPIEEVDKSIVSDATIF
jgi:hypothetical protein